jgi:formamidopyrimidine-DNA glycosylase
MEGPQIVVYQRWLAPWAGRVVRGVSGERAGQAEWLVGRPLPGARVFGKLLFFPEGERVLRLHCLLFGDVRVNRDRPGKRLTLRIDLAGGDFFGVWLGAAKTVPISEFADLPAHRDVMGERFDPPRAWREAAAARPTAAVGDLLLDQAFFPGLGNKMRADGLWHARLHPLTPAAQIPVRKGAALLRASCDFGLRLAAAYEDNFGQPRYDAYRRKRCPRCETMMLHELVGELQRKAHWCPKCQKLPA